MARILLIDNNPENRKSIEGLLRYRTRHTFASVDSCQLGARKAIAFAPDLIMINALMFMSNNYAFPRVLQQHEKTIGLSFLVHATVSLDEVTHKQIEASGVASILFLPASADELEAGIQAALGHRPAASKSDVQPVSWPRVKQAAKKTSPKTTRKSVLWSQASKNEKPVKKPKRVVKNRPAFQSLTDSAPKERPTSGFRASTFEHVDEKDVKGEHHTFQNQTWDRVDPKEVKRRRR